MTIYVEEEELVQNLAFNIANQPSGTYVFTITSESSHQPTIMTSNQLVSTNARWSLFQFAFPAGFGDEHKNGIYYYELKRITSPVAVLQAGLAKIITNPGGRINTIAYDSGAVTEERVSDVYYRPQY